MALFLLLSLVGCVASKNEESDRVEDGSEQVDANSGSMEDNDLPPLPPDDTDEGGKAEPGSDDDSLPPLPE